MSKKNNDQASPLAPAAPGADTPEVVNVSGQEPNPYVKFTPRDAGGAGQQSPSAGLRNVDAVTGLPFRTEGVTDDSSRSWGRGAANKQTVIAPQAHRDDLPFEERYGFPPEGLPKRTMRRVPGNARAGDTYDNYGDLLVNDRRNSNGGNN